MRPLRPTPSPASLPHPSRGLQRQPPPTGRKRAEETSYLLSKVVLFMGLWRCFRRARLWRTDPKWGRGKGYILFRREFKMYEGNSDVLGRQKFSRSHFSSALRDLLRESISFYVRLFSFFDSNFNLEIFYDLIWTWSSSSRNRRTNKIVVCVPMSDWKKMEGHVDGIFNKMLCMHCGCRKLLIEGLDIFREKKLNNME